MEKSPSWAANISSDRHATPCVLWNPKIHYRIHKSPPSHCILNQLNPVHFHHPTSWISILILPSLLTPESSKWYISLTFPHQTPVYTFSLLHMCYIPRPSHSSPFDHLNKRGEEQSLLCCSLRIRLHFPAVSLLLGPNMFLSTPFSKTLALYSSQKIRSQVSRPYKTGNIMTIYIRISVFLY